MGGLDGITEIVKERYQTGAYGNTHFAMSASTLAALKAVEPRWRQMPSPLPSFGLPPVDALLSIPIRADDELPDGEWRLIDNTTDEVLRSGGTSEVTDGR